LNFEPDFGQVRKGSGSNFGSGPNRGITTYNDIKLIDFNWAGQFGEVRYPMNINRSTIKRPPTVFNGELVTSEDDCYMVDLILPN